SSMSAVMGSPGQGNYVSANAFLDALACRRQAEGLAATSIGWGAWGEVGMAAQGTASERLSTHGVRAMAPADGVQALGLALAEGAPRLAIAAMDWAAIGQQFTSDRV